MKEVEISFYQIEGGRIKSISDSFRYDLPIALVWTMNTAKDYPEANHIKIFLDEEHNDYLCFDKDENGIWSHTTEETYSEWRKRTCNDRETTKRIVEAK